MIQELSYKRKFDLLSFWSQEIFRDIKKELKSEHVKKDSILSKSFSDKKGVDKLSFDELSSLCFHRILEGDEDLGEWVASRWMLKHADVYHFFAEELSAINPKFDEITSLDPKLENQLQINSCQQFGAIDTYVFCVLNSVCFSDAVYESLKRLAEKQGMEQRESKRCEEKKEVTVEELSRLHAEEILKITDRYERKMQGVLKKYHIDVEGFKKQISKLQKRLEEVRIGS